MNLARHLIKNGLTLLAVTLSVIACAKDAPRSYEEQALEKIAILEELMDDARSKDLDVTREETVLWFSKEFLKFASWDAENIEANEYLFGVYHEPFRSQKEKLAKELPDFERKKVIEILDKGISNLKDVLSGEIVRRPVNKVDWQNIEVAEDVLLSNGRPIFLYDYFSKSLVAPYRYSSVQRSPRSYIPWRRKPVSSRSRPCNQLLPSQRGRYLGPGSPERDYRYRRHERWVPPFLERGHPRLDP